MIYLFPFRTKHLISDDILSRCSSLSDPKCWGSSFFYRQYSKYGWNTQFPQMNLRNISSCVTKDPDGLPWTSGDKFILRATMAAGLPSITNVRSFATQAKAPAQARQMGALQVSMLSPGFVYEPYAPREKIPFWKRWFTRSGWRRTEEDVILELKSAYAIAKLRKTGYNKHKFYNEAFDLYKEISTLVAQGNKTSLRKLVTEKMYSALKNEIKLRESKWSKLDWELVGPAVKIRTLRARLIGVDRNDLSKVFVQLTLEFLTKQKFEACDATGNVVAGDKDKEVLVREIWVFEKSLFHPGASWRLCGRINT
ncbi:OLC1v1000548C3 [Oldenlandia corymbosa var. corymbosa]|uniref:Large ribosomal subunit protein mL45 n=1 Tax=Oldenlandia corymbosa var. corymbosa TaxID=529605 RepID=A0AAV1D657_OLDCO|nr:OLC1v1000548C3 [Oldenlandia corymbosa var. corymbosa]